MTRAATILTLLCAGTVGLFALSWALLPKTGMEQLALIVPWMLMLGTHLLLGPIALVLCLRDRRRVGHLGIYAYFLVFAAVQAFVLIRATDLDAWAVDRYDRVVHRDEYALSGALAEALGRKQLGKRPDEDDFRELLRMARDLPRIERRFEKHRLSPLTHAAALGNRELVRLMLERGAPVSGSPQGDDAPLLAAAASGDPEMVKLLLEAGAEPSRVGSAGENALLLLILAGVEEGVPELLDAGADPNAESRINQARPLGLAVGRGEVSLVRILLAAGADPNHPGGRGENLGLVAANRGDAETFRLLREAGLSLSLGQQTLLHRATTEGNVQQLERLLAVGADPDLPDEQGQSSLGLVAAGRVGQEGADEPGRAAAVARLLIRHGADVNRRSRSGGTALVRAASRPDRPEVCRVLIEAGADVNATDGSDERTALMNAARAGPPDVVELLLAAGANPNAKSVGLNRSTALVDAVGRGDADIVQALLAAGARVRPPERYWGDAFRGAAPHPELVRALVRHGGDVNAEDELHRLPVEEVIRYGVPGSLEVMLAAGARVRCSRVRSLLDPSRSRPQDAAARAGMARLLVRPCPALEVE